MNPADIAAAARQAAIHPPSNAVACWYCEAASGMPCTSMGDQPRYGLKVGDITRRPHTFRMKQSTGYFGPEDNALRPEQTREMCENMSEPPGAQTPDGSDLSSGTSRKRLL